MTETYLNANLAVKPSQLKNIYNANAEGEIHKIKKLWIDADVFGLHLGIDCRKKLLEFNSGIWPQATYLIIRPA